MANKMTGKLGRIYYSSAFIRANTISFSNSLSEIRDSGNGFVTAGFAQGNKIDIIGSALNDGGKTIASGGVEAGALTVTVAPVLEAAGDRITIIKVPPDTQWTGFFNWSLDLKADIHDVTDFADGANNAKGKIAAIKDWTATAERYWQSDQNQKAFLGTNKWVRFFIKYVASPSVENPSHYFEGECLNIGITQNVPVGGVIDEPFTFDGNGTLRFVTRTSAWTT